MNVKVIDMFPLKKSKHNTELRRTKKFEENIKRTERYKKGGST